MTSEKSGLPLAKIAGFSLAGIGLLHFVKPELFEPVTSKAFPRRTRQHVYTNGGIETAIGLGLSAQPTRPAAIVGVLGYLAYLGGAAARNAR